MWNAFFARRQFYNKCKSAVRMISMRMEIIIKKRSAMQKFLKNDVADLLRTNLDHNAYKRAQALYMEQNQSWCYNYVHECCTLVSDKLTVMETQSECPEECRVAVASLGYTAARFADLPELRDLRSLFSDKYGHALDPFVNKELVEKLKSNPPTMEVTFQLMKDVGNEFTIPWDPASLEQKLCTQQDRSAKGYKSYNTMPENNGITRNESTGRQRAAYETSASGNRELDPRRPFGSNIVHAPYVQLKKDQDGSSGRPGNLEAKDVRKDADGEDNDEKSNEEPMMDRIMRHYSMKSWIKGHNERTESSRGSPSGVYGRSASMYEYQMHPKLPDYDQLASRIEALRKM